MNRTYSSYHTYLKLCFALGIEMQILPDDFLKSIPTSTSHSWKTKNITKYYGSEYDDILSLHIEDLKRISDQRVAQSRKLFVSFCRFYLTLIHLIGKQNFNKILRENRQKVVPMIDHLISSVGISHKTLVLKFLNISSKQFSRWKTLEQYSCRKSLIWLCYKRIPRQISSFEIGVMKNLMSDKTMAYWSSASVWGFAVKHKMTSMSRPTWYLYCKLLQLNRTRKRYKKVRKRISVRANFPNQIWHMDVSIYKILDGVKYYIYSIVDNFSRKILAFDYSTELSAKTRIKSLKSAITSLKLQGKTISTIDLIVDGGSENNNKTVADFIKTCQVNLDKRIPLKDVLYSNSMIESGFRMLKSYYLKAGISSEDFPNELSIAIEDINYKRPHYAHLIYTPDEVYPNPELKNIFPKLQELEQQRLQDNQSLSCDSACKL